MWLKQCPAVEVLCANLGNAPNQLTRVNMGVDHHEAQIARMLLPILALPFPTLLTREVSKTQGCNRGAVCLLRTYTDVSWLGTLGTGGTSRAVPQARIC